MEMDMLPLFLSSTSVKDWPYTFENYMPLFYKFLIEFVYMQFSGISLGIFKKTKTKTKNGSESRSNELYFSFLKY